MHLVHQPLYTFDESGKLCSYSSVEFHFPIFAAFIPEVLFEGFRLDDLSLRKGSQSQGKSEDGSCEDKTFHHVKKSFPSQVERSLPRFTGSVILGLFFSHSVLCNRTRTKGGSTMIGVEFRTLLKAVSPTANVAAFLLFPRLCA